MAKKTVNKRHSKNQPDFAATLTPFVIIGVLALAIVGMFLWQRSKDQVNSFDTCAMHHPVMESFPEQCIDHGRTYIKMYKNTQDY